MSLQLLLAGEAAEGTDYLKELEAAINRLQPLWLKQGTIGLALVDDETISALNESYGEGDYVTDVLSFSYLEEEPPKGAEGELGDIAISLDAAKRQADEYGQKLPEEIALLVLHGAMHILGFDHADKAAAEAMQAEQQRILAAAGIKCRDMKWEL